jgi:hypothetical protein
MPLSLRWKFIQLAANLSVSEAGPKNDDCEATLFCETYEELVLTRQMAGLKSCGVN